MASSGKPRYQLASLSSTWHSACCEQQLCSGSLGKSESWAHLRPQRMAWGGQKLMPKARHGQWVSGHIQAYSRLSDHVSLGSRPSRNGDPRPKCKKSLPHPQEPAMWPKLGPPWWHRCIWLAGCLPGHSGPTLPYSPGYEQSTPT